MMLEFRKAKSLQGIVYENDIWNRYKDPDGKFNDLMVLKDDTIDG